MVTGRCLRDSGHFGDFLMTFFAALRVTRTVGWLAFFFRMQVWHLLLPLALLSSLYASFSTPQPEQATYMSQRIVLTCLLPCLSRLILSDSFFSAFCRLTQSAHFQTPLAGIWSTRTTFVHRWQLKAL